MLAKFAIPIATSHIYEQQHLVVSTGYFQLGASQQRPSVFYVMFNKNIKVSFSFLFASSANKSIKPLPMFENKVKLTMSCSTYDLMQ